MSWASGRRTRGSGPGRPVRLGLKSYDEAGEPPGNPVGLRNKADGSGERLLECFGGADRAIERAAAERGGALLKPTPLPDPADIRTTIIGQAVHRVTPLADRFRRSFEGR
jgi:hypothetical protein